ncbi:coiled-coil domain-containing protein 24 isoform X2 [Scophthalmus maximus]|nr:coiled-coil domain-containing protein 24 isoform X2 [Scophthalmus maximus]
MPSPDESQLWCPGPSLWSLIAEHVPGSELSKIQTALGHFLVDMYTEAHTEAEMWCKMWQESRRGGNHGSRAGTPLPRPRGSPLADPPAVKELLRAEVKMLLQTLRERVTKGGRDGDTELLSLYKPETVNYALGHLDSRHSDCISPGDTDDGSRPSSHRSVGSSAGDEIEAARDKLNVADIDQVVERLRSVLMEECEVLKRLVQNLKRNIKGKCSSQGEFGKSEPTLAELRELRGAVQMDLELYPASFAASSPTSPPLPVKGLKNRFRLSAGQRASDETLQTLHSTSVLRPHPPPPRCHPRPPVGPPVTKTSASVEPVHSSSSSRTHGQRRSTLGSNASSSTPGCGSKLTTSGHHFPTDQIKVMNEYPCSPPPDQDCRPLTYSPSFPIKPPRNSPAHEAQSPCHRSVHSLSRGFDMSGQRERQSGAVGRSRDVSVTPSSIPPLSPASDAGSYSNSSADPSGSTTANSDTQNGQKKSTHGGGVVSASVQADNDQRKNTSESLYSSVTSETGRHPAKKCDWKIKSRTERNINGHLGKEITKQQSASSHCLTDYSSHHRSESNGEKEGQAKCTQAASVQSNVKCFTLPKRLRGGTASQPTSVQEAQTEPALINKFYQPVPPPGVST